MRKLCLGQLWSVSAIVFSCLVFQSCEALGFASIKSKGELRISFAGGQEILTRSGLEIPDTSDFILTVTDSKGRTLYDGLYGSSPESFEVDAGSYVIRVLSTRGSPYPSLPQTYMQSISLR